MLEAIERAIEQKLELVLASEEIRLRVFPDSPRDLGKPLAHQVLVGYKRSLFADVSEHPLNQVQTLEFEITIQVPSLRTHQGAYPLLDGIRFGLSGFIPVGGTTRCMRCVGERLVDFNPKEGVWVYGQTWQMAVQTVEGQNPVIDFPPIDPNLPIGFIPTKIVTGLWRAKLPDAHSPNPALDRLLQYQVPPP
jgi:hypothetical protein